MCIDSKNLSNIPLEVTVRLSKGVWLNKTFKK